MKTIKTIFSIAFLMNATLSNATVRTCSNDPAGGAQYATFQAVYNASSNGDTILLEGTNIIYTMTNDYAKQLVIIGIGFNPTKTNPRHAIIYQMSSAAGRISFTTAGNGSKFFGIDFPVLFNGMNLTSSIDNYSFEDCDFQNLVDLSAFPVSNIAFRNCLFLRNNNDDVYFSSTLTASNVMFESCIFNGDIFGQNNSSNTLTIDHCVFLQNTYTSINNVQNAIIKNCIFMNNASIANSSSINNTFSNNISRLNTTFPPAGNMGSGNITNTDPLMINCPAGQTYSTAHNYALQAGSPCVGAGLLGSDIGPHGSGSHFNESGEVLINPIVRTVNIGNTNVAPNGNLNIQINATKPNDQ